jgi:hypothetical protein
VSVGCLCSCILSDNCKNNELLIQQ